MDWPWVHSCEFCQKMQIQVPTNFEPDGDQSISLNLTFKYSGSRHVVNRILLNLEPGSTTSLSKASSWLSDCLANHPKRSLMSTCESPARLLNLVQGESAVCLVPNHQNFNYEALSYCWGGDQEYKLTRARLAAYQTFIAVARLPKSVQDAIKVAQSRDGISYIWIDSRCIIQDDDNDKGSQLANMGDIYRGAMVTISAASARSCYEGFLQPRECPEKAKPTVKIPFISKAGTRGDVYLVPHASRETDPDPINYCA